MSVVVPKRYLSQFLFALCVAVPMWNNYELTFAVWMLAFLATIQKSYSYQVLKYASCFVAIITIAFVVMLTRDYISYYIIRDITYLLKPILGTFIGYHLCRSNFNKAFETIVYTGVILAVIHIITIFYAFIFQHAHTVNDIRLRSGFFSDFEVYAVIILIFHKQFEIDIPKRKIQLFTLMVGFSALMYLARTNFIQFAILLVGMKGYFKINRTSITVILSLIATVIIGYAAILSYNPRRGGPGIEVLLYKIKIAPGEAFKTKINADDWRDFNDNYRSYENIHTVKQMTRNGTPTILFGAGMGSRIDLKREVWLGDMYLRYISILHNGFMTVFLKTGLLGILIYLWSILLMFRQPKSEIPIVKNINLLLVGTGIFLFFSNWVFMGVYNLLDNKSLLIGFLICYIGMAINKHEAKT